MYSQLRSSSSTISAQDYQLKYPLLGGLYNALITGRSLTQSGKKEKKEYYPKEIFQLRSLARSSGLELIRVCLFPKYPFENVIYILQIVFQVKDIFDLLFIQIFPDLFIL